MKKLLLLVSLIVLSCASVEERIKEHSYTEEWNYYQGERYQVYRTKRDKKYIIINTSNLYRVKRMYIQAPVKGGKNDTSYLEKYLTVEPFFN